MQAERKSLSVYTAERRDPFSIFSFFGATCIAQQKGAENARGRVIFGQLITFFIGSTKISDGKNKRRAHTFPRVCCAVALADNSRCSGCKIPLSPFCWRRELMFTGLPPLVCASNSIQEHEKGLSFPGKIHIK